MIAVLQYLVTKGPRGLHSVKLVVPTVVRQYDSTLTIVLVRQYVVSQKGHVLGNITRTAPDSVLVRKPVKVIVKK